MIRLAKPSLILIGFAALGLVRPIDNGVEVRPFDKELFETESKHIVTAGFQVSSVTPGRHLFEAGVKLPDKWILITEDFPFELDPYQSVTKWISFFVADSTAPGKYNVTYEVRAREFPSISGAYTVTVAVLPYGKDQPVQKEDE